MVYEEKTPGAPQYWSIRVGNSHPLLPLLCCLANRGTNLPSVCTMYLVNHNGFDVSPKHGAIIIDNGPEFRITRCSCFRECINNLVFPISNPHQEIRICIHGLLADTTCGDTHFRKRFDLMMPRKLIQNGLRPRD